MRPFQANDQSTTADSLSEPIRARKPAVDKPSLWLRPGMFEHAVKTIDPAAVLACPGTWTVRCPACLRPNAFVRIELPAPLLWCGWHAPPLSMEAALLAREPDRSRLRVMVADWLRRAQDIERISWILHCLEDGHGHEEE